MRPALPLSALVLAMSCTEEAPPVGTVLSVTPVEGGTMVTEATGLPGGEVTEMFVPGPPDGGWPEMGLMRATVDGRPYEWSTFDFSVGAFDATAWFQPADADGMVRMTLRGLPDGDAEADRGWLVVRGVLPALAPGRVEQASVGLTLADSVVGPRWESLPGTATVRLDSLRRDGDEVYGDATGRYSARVCRTDGVDGAFDESDCREVSGTFDTEVQFDRL